MDSANHRIEINDDRHVYALMGTLDINAVDALRRSISPDHTPCRHLVVDLRELQHCTREARRALVDVHRVWSKNAHRIAYLATEPRIRGLSLWIMHMAGDDEAKAVGSEASLKQWLESDKGRQAGAFATLGIKRPPPFTARRETLGLTQRAVSRAFVWMAKFSVGEPLEWVSEIIRVHGVAGLMRWTKTLQKALDRLSNHYGDLYAQTLFGLSAMWNGCRSCSRGHLLSANMLYFEATKKLFPLPDTLALTWQHMNDSEAIVDILDRLEGIDDLDELRTLIAQYYELRQGTLSQEESAEIEYLREVDALWTLFNECSIVQPLEPTVTPRMPKHYRKRDVLAAYKAARAKHEAALARDET